MEYRVAYSEWVRSSLKTLLARAKKIGRGEEFLDAVKQLDAALRRDPQQGEPLMDLDLEPGQIRILSIGPLAVRYVLNEQKRLVMVVVPFMPLRSTGL